MERYEEFRDYSGIKSCEVVGRWIRRGTKGHIAERRVKSR